MDELNADKVLAEASCMTSYHSPLVLIKWINRLITALEQSQKRVAELEGDNHCLRVNLQALVTETPSGWTLTLEQAKADAMQALEDCKALSRKDGE